MGGVVARHAPTLEAAAAAHYYHYRATEWHPPWRMGGDIVIDIVAGRCSGGQVAGRCSVFSTYIAWGRESVAS